MRKITSLGVYFYVLTAIASLVIINFLIFNFSKKQNILSPLPSFLTIFKNNQVSTINLWLPSLENELNSNLKKPEITAVSALLFDLTTNRILFSKNPREKLPMASLTKIMTAVIALANKKENDKYTVRKEHLVGEDVMGLSENEVLSLKELLYGLILHSGNDAAETLATNFEGGRKGFIKAMNDKAKSLGLSDTNFTNPTGLEGDGKQYTTAYDLLVITNYAISKFPEFNEVVSTFDYQIPRTKTHKAYYLENETNLLTSYPGVRGVKTGYTSEAGECLVTYLEYKNHKILGILLNSQNRRGEMKDLLDFALKSQGVKPPPHD